MTPLPRHPLTRRAQIRLDDETITLLEKLAEELRASRSYVVRLAVRELAKRRLPKEEA